MGWCVLCKSNSECYLWYRQWCVVERHLALLPPLWSLHLHKQDAHQSKINICSCKFSFLRTKLKLLLLRFIHILWSQPTTRGTTWAANRAGLRSEPWRAKSLPGFSPTNHCSSGFTSKFLPSSTRSVKFAYRDFEIKTCRLLHLHGL